MQMHLKVQSKKFQALNLTSSDNNIFYGTAVASVDSFIIRGPFNDIDMQVHNVQAAEPSQIFIPVSSSGDLSTYSYVSFKTYGKNQDKLVRKNKSKIHFSLDATLNDLAFITIVLDPATDDRITATGEGQIYMDIPPDNDMTIHGVCSITQGNYHYTFRNLFNRQFDLIAGSKINFNGPFNSTTLNVDAIYAVKARLYDMLTDADKLSVTGNDLIDAETPQMVDVKLNMSGLLSSPKLTFNIDLEDKHSQNGLAYQRLMVINSDDQQKFNQVAALLLIKGFLPPDGIGSGTVYAGAFSSAGQILSSSVSSGLTNALNRITGDKKFNVDVKYANYNYADQTSIAANRSQVKADVSWNLFNDRLVVELGSTSDWGHATSTSSTSNFNVTGDFRIQYLLSQGSPLRLNAFRTSDYDVTLDRDIIRSGVGVTWKKSFDGLNEFFRSNKYMERRKAMQEKAATPAQDTTGKTDGTD